MKIYNYILSVFAAAAALVALSACSEGDDFESGREIVVFTGADYSPVVKTNVDPYPLTVTATGKAKETVTVKVKYDDTAVDEYNELYGTTYVAIPSAYVSLDSDTMTIEAGEVTSDINYVAITSKDYVEDGYIYVLPLRITSVKGSGMELLQASSSILLRATNTFTFYSLDLNNYMTSSNYIFDDSQALDLSVYTYEINVYVESFKDSGNRDADICRLCAWEAEDESTANMLRFSEAAYEIGTLQLVSPAGNLVSSTIFDTGKWYHLSFVYDGSTMTMYIDGSSDATVSGDGDTTFQRFELGMSWTTYYQARQLFTGRISEMRLWNRALSTAEMQEGVCNVAAASDGLVAYWKFDEGSGHIFTDYTGNGYDMDWSDTYRYDNESSFDNLDLSDYVTWVYDDDNTCTN